MTLRSDRITCRVDPKTAMIAEVTVGDRLVLTGGPSLAYVPTFSKIQQRAMKGEEPRPTPIYGSNWRVKSVTVGQRGTEVEICWSGSYDEAQLEGSYRFTDEGELVIDYRLVLNPKIIETEDLVFIASEDESSDQGRYLALVEFCDDGTAMVKGKRPEEEPVAVSAERVAAVPRQLGILLRLPMAIHTLRWDRPAQWTAYPPGHIGRPTGTAKAFPAERETRESLGQRPDWPWSAAACELGTRDFRSTKSNVNWAALTDETGYGVKLVSNGSQSARTFVQDGCVNWLIAEIDNPPSETFMAGYFDRFRKPVPLGEPVSGSIRLRFMDVSSQLSQPPTSSGE